jgi:hypothetical protein
MGTIVTQGLTPSITIPTNITTQGLAYPTTAQTPIYARGEGNTHTAVYTVPAGKTLYITGILYGNETATSAEIGLEINASIPLCDVYVLAKSSISISGGIIKVLVAGDTLRTTNGTGGGTQNHIWGFLM